MSKKRSCEFKTLAQRLMASALLGGLAGCVSLPAPPPADETSGGATEPEVLSKTGQSRTYLKDVRPFPGGVGLVPGHVFEGVTITHKAGQCTEMTESIQKWNHRAVLNNSVTVSEPVVKVAQREVECPPITMRVVEGGTTNPTDARVIN